MSDLSKMLREYKARKAASRASRREFLVRVGSASLGVAAGGIIAGCGGGGGSFGPANGQNGGGGYVSTGELVKAFQDIQLDENNHVTDLIAAITNTFGAAAVRPRPQFDPNLLDISKNASYPNASGASDSVANLINATADLENTGTGAYPYVLTNPNFASSLATAQAAGTIAIVEGRHAGFVNSLLGRLLLTDPNQGDTGAPAGSVEVIQPPSKVAGRAAPFLVAGGNLANIQPGSAPTGTAFAGTGTTYLRGYTYNPDGGLNGAAGTPVPNDNVSSNGAITLAGILNYALLLEYLERDFYNLNIPNVLGSMGYTRPAGAIAYNPDPTTP
ncbi:MAG: ferritin-like domain-containing protein [Armatimonadetes bacterium]|nr:ferritin-like domain-containing protein [Armatimonadota bacterium]